MPHGRAPPIVPGHRDRPNFGTRQDEAVQFCQGNSWLIQLMGAEVWEVSSGPTIALFDVQVASDRVRQKLNQWFFPRLTRGCTDKELEILALIANGSHHEIMNFDSVSDCANFLQLDGTWAVRYALTELAKRDLIELEYTDRPIYDNDGFGVRLSVPMMDDYFRATGGIFGFSAVHHTNNEKSEPYSRTSELPGKSDVPRGLVTPRRGAERGWGGPAARLAWSTRTHRGRVGRNAAAPSATFRSDERLDDVGGLFRIPTAIDPGLSTSVVHPGCK